MTLALPPNLTERKMRPSAGRASEQAFRSLIRTLGLLERVMQPYFARFGISGSQWGALRALHRAELDGQTGLRVTDLSEKLLVRPPSVTGALDRLERNGLVLRDAAPDDLRAKCVRLTRKGRRLVEHVLSVHARQIDTVLGGLGATDREQLQRLLDQLSAHLEGLLERPVTVGE